MPPERWEIDTGHSGIHFSVRHMAVATVRGRFARWSGVILAHDGGFDRVSVDIVIDAWSIETGVTDRDTHLRSADFFDVANYPEITFKGTRAEELDDQPLRIVGDLTIRGVSREQVLAVEYAGRATDPWGNQRAGFTARTSLDRKDYGLTWNQSLKAGGFMIDDRVEIVIDVEAVRASAYERRLLELTNELQHWRGRTAQVA